MTGILLFISGPEILIVFLFVLLFFGAGKIPEIARTLGKGLNEFKKAADDIKKEMNNHTGNIKKDFKDLGDEISKSKDDLLG